MSTAVSDEPRILERPDHPISRKRIHTNAIKVLYRLHRSGHKAYMCGGAVRDLMLGVEPKDYDVATDARPPQIRRLFRNSRIIGRRFRLAHVYFKEGIIEVATFRRDPEPQNRAAPGGELLITDDNVFGTPREDAFRRDFTVNALFYSIADFSVIDYTGGIEDLEAGRIRTIGEPEIRFQEDPVRMMRACELAGRLDFTIDPATQEAISAQRHGLDKAAPARLTEEVLQLLRCGRAARVMQWMLELGLLEILLPEALAMTGPGTEGNGRILGVLDRLASEGRILPDPALLAALLLPAVRAAWSERASQRRRPLSEAVLRQAALGVVAPVCARFTLSKQRAEYLAELLLTFERMRAKREWKGAARVYFAQRASFDDALLLLEIECLASGRGERVLGAWKGVAQRRPARRKSAPRPRRRPRGGRRRRRPRRR